MRPLFKAFRRHPTGTALFLGVILYGWCVASTHSDDNSATECVAEWNFGTKEDVGRDGWPDNWTRRIERDYPKFIPIAIHQNARSAEELREIENFRRLASQCCVAWQQGKWPWQVIPEKVPPSIDKWLERTLLNPYLRFLMDGGAAEVVSSPIPIDVHSVYFMTSSVLSDSADFEAGAKLRFLDKSRKTLFEMPTEQFFGKTGWKNATTRSQYPFRDDIDSVQVVLQVLPKSMKAFRGEFGFDTVRVFRTPRLSLFVNKASPYYRHGDEVVAHCTASGMTSEQSSIRLLLIDHTGQEVASANKLFVRSASAQPRLISKGGSGGLTSNKTYWDGSCEWRLQNLAPGYYELTTRLAKGKSGVFELEEQFVVLPNDGYGKPDSRFGWTMSRRNNEDLEEIDTNSLVELLRLSRVGKVKIPIWFDSQDPLASKTYLERVDRVQLTGVGCVGVIASPPKTIRNKFARLNNGETGSALEDSVLVLTYLEPVLRQICARLSDFQIGWDHETDLVSNPRLYPALDAIKNLARRYGQEPQIAAARNPMLATPIAPAIDRWQLYNTEQFTDKETIDAVEKKNLGIRTPWLSVTPLNASDYSLAVRVQDLVSRMVAIAGEPGVQGTTAWVSNPTEPEIGLLDYNGGPREMFLPFRSTAVALSGLNYVGSLPIPSLGVNHLVASGDKAVLAVWSARPTIAQLYLGENVSARDVWGRPVSVETVETQFGPQQQLAIDKWPIFISDVNLKVARWRMGIELEERHIDPLVGQTQEIKIRVANPFPELLTGELRVFAPTMLAEDSSVAIEIEGNSSAVVPVPVQIKPDANTAAAMIQLEFTVQSDQPLKFVVDQEIQVGSKDIEIEVRYEIDGDDRLRVLIEAVNYQSTPVSFDCMLLIPNRPRERTQIAGLRDRVAKLILLEKASELIGKTLWLRCEQISTNRIINKRVEISP